MAKWITAKDGDPDDHNKRSTANLPAHTQENKIVAGGITVYVGDSGGIGSGNTLANGVLADQDEVEDTPTVAQFEQAFTESIAAGGGDNPKDTDDTTGEQRVGENAVCGSVPAYPPDSYSLSPNFNLGMLSSKTVFPHRVAAQGGRSVGTIVCNLKAVAVNLLEPLKVKYPGFRINSGFRRGKGNSKHNMGCAVDIQWAGISPAAYLPRAKWIRDNLPIDAIIFEHGKSIWLHIQYVREYPAQRGIVQTMYRGKYQPGLKLYY